LISYKTKLFSFSHLISGEGLERNAEMKLICGEENRIVNISEPKKCHYEIAFASNFACGKSSIK
jgi:hypothetical protein